MTQQTVVEDPFVDSETGEVKKPEALFTLPPFDALSGVAMVAHYERKGGRVAIIDFNVEFSATAKIEDIPVVTTVKTSYIENDGANLAALAAQLKAVFGEPQKVDRPKPRRGGAPYYLVTFGHPHAASDADNPF